MNLKGSNTEKNLYKAFAGESRARNKYNLYAEKAREEGFRWVGEIFDETASNEFAHAREVFRRYLNKVGTTEENLMDAAMGEKEEDESIYKEFERVANEEGFKEIATFFKELREVEESHEIRFLSLAERIRTDRMFKSDTVTFWQCMNCGYIHEGLEAPMICPLCKFKQEYFMPYCKKG
ncbi:MAG: rubrerythrin family protein [Clostridium baratii]|uniref:Rubrerythrin family protein n=1 Tax=Clostridium baratii str. Sullivan TaxID=1415775 RepID=A0A0A7FRJ5_9CLOT|nr:rubrerythrin family protein [Clostridium baratii]AIY82244.1 rubrerythrin family protein [Clostridium baratii str. Sullivan]MBS6007678.1 rubrerythrin family protein [Clostridium baratii]MDU1054470.1 rubrerythrin family protein [Clostridium baratii]MDU4911552.1 rubrerythrin family protein [Clostridium baratii]CUP59359.1 rubrerythrin [Clostridium baratii]